MGLSNQQRSQIADLLKNQIRRKLSKYSPESSHMPFHVRLLGRDRLALFSFVQSINTTLGTSVFEQIAAMVAGPYFKRVVNQYKEFNNTISENAQTVIQRIIDDLRATRVRPDKPAEIAEILRVAQSGIIREIKRPRIDLFLESNNGSEYYFDLKTVKPNRDDVFGYKRKMLEWVAIRGAVNPKPNKIYTGLVLPYNPYEPQPYNRWTFQDVFDLPNEIKVAEEFWDFLAGENTYRELLSVFEEVGVQLRPEIEAKFAAFAPELRDE